MNIRSTTEIKEMKRFFIFGQILVTILLILLSKEFINLQIIINLTVSRNLSSKYPTRIKEETTTIRES